MNASSTAGVWLLLLGLIVFSQAGCSSASRRLAPKIVQQVQVGMTRTQLEQLLGPPSALHVAPEDKELAIFSYSIFQDSPRDDLMVKFKDGRLGSYRIGGELLCRMLTVLYDGAGTIERVHFSDTRTPYYQEVEVMQDGVGRSWVGTEITPDLLSSIQKGVTTLAELELMLGDPMWTSFSPHGARSCGWYFQQVIGRHIPSRKSYEFVAEIDDEKVVVNHSLTPGISLSPSSR